MKRSAQRGFSLVELMVVVAIIGIGAAMAGPNLTGMLANERTRETAEKFHVLLKEAQLAAKQKGKLSFIKTDAAGTSVTKILRYEDTNGNNKLDSADTLVEQLDLPGNVKVGPSSGYGSTFEYSFVKPNTACSFCSTSTAVAVDEAGQLYTASSSSGSNLVKLDAIYINFVPDYDFSNADSEHVRMVLATSTGMVKTWTK